MKSDAKRRIIIKHFLSFRITSFTIPSVDTCIEYIIRKTFPSSFFKSLLYFRNTNNKKRE